MRDSSCERRHRSTWSISGGRAYCPSCREDRGWVAEPVVSVEDSAPSSAPPSAPSSPPPAPERVPTPPTASAPSTAPEIDTSFTDSIRSDDAPEMPVSRPGRVQALARAEAKKEKPSVIRPKRPV